MINAQTGKPMPQISIIGNPMNAHHLICSDEYHLMSMWTLTLVSFPTETHWNILRLDLVSAGWSKNKITMMLTTMLLFMSCKHFLKIVCKIAHITEYKMIRNIGNNEIRNILNIAALGANPFISLSCIKQSNDTKDSEDDPIVCAGENKSFTTSG